MLARHWTTEIIVISVVLAMTSAVIGYFIAVLRQGRQINVLAAQVEQAQQHQAPADMIALSALSHLMLTSLLLATTSKPCASILMTCSQGLDQSRCHA